MSKSISFYMAKQFFYLCTFLYKILNILINFYIISKYSLKNRFFFNDSAIDLYFFLKNYKKLFVLRDVKSQEKQFLHLLKVETEKKNEKIMAGSNNDQLFKMRVSFVTHGLLHGTRIGFTSKTQIIVSIKVTIIFHLQY